MIRNRPQANASVLTLPQSCGEHSRLDDLPQDLKRHMVATMPLDALCRLGCTSQSWRDLSRERPELERAALAPLLRAGEDRAVARVLADARLMSKVDINRPDAYGMTALMVAASLGKSTVAERLLMLGASAMPCDLAGLSAKTWAAIGGHEDCWNTLRFLDDRGVEAGFCQLEATPMPRESALLGLAAGEAAQRGHAPLVAALAAKGADICQRDASGWTPLHHLARAAAQPHEALSLVVSGRPELLRVLTAKKHTLAHVIARYAAQPELGLAYLAARHCPLSEVATDATTPWMLVQCHALSPHLALEVLTAAGAQPSAAAEPQHTHAPVAARRRPGWLRRLGDLSVFASSPRPTL